MWLRAQHSVAYELSFCTTFNINTSRLEKHIVERFATHKPS
jgi:hypothetical protein